MLPPVVRAAVASSLAVLAASTTYAEEPKPAHPQHDHGVIATVKTGATELPVMFENDRLVAEAKLFLTTCAKQIVDWAAAPEVVDAVRRRNELVKDPEHAKRVDAQWQAGQSEGLQQELTISPCGVSLRRNMGAEPERQYQHAFVTDVHGGLVCMSDKTARYWHGADTTWTNAFNYGSGAVFVSRPQIDENLNQPLVHIAVPIHGNRGVIGVLIVGKGVHNTKAGERAPHKATAEGTQNGSQATVE